MTHVDHHRSDAPPPFDLLRPRRPITGISAVLLPFTDAGLPDLDSLCGLVARTAEAGLAPAVNMDTGYGNLLEPQQRDAVLAAARSVVGAGPLVAGAWVDDRPGDRWRATTQLAAVEAVAAHGATPVICPSHGLSALAGDEVVAAHAAAGEHCERFIAFELDPVFSPAGRIWDLDTWSGVMAVPACAGAKHSSLRRDLEWDRLRRRDAERPDVAVFTGNDLAIDMVMYGSDYLLGLSALAPDLFAARDAAWAAGDPSFFERNDDLQALGSFAFRSPVPAYKHDAALFLQLRGWLPAAAVHPQAATRPSGEAGVLATLLARLERWT